MKTTKNKIKIPSVGTDLLRSRVDSLKRQLRERDERLGNLGASLKQAQQVMIDRTHECQNLNADIRRLEQSNTNIQLENFQLRAHRDVLLSALSDAQRRLQLLRKFRKDQKCGCGSGVNEDLDACAMPFTDQAAEVL